jgi:uncharacterized Ntn-hydrolase superfamily protein
VTFSILGRCARSGEFGCALATSSMAVGGRCHFVAPGIGAVLSQARSDPMLGSFGLARLAAGRSAAEALSDMVASTPHAAWRPLAVLDRDGRIAEHTGAKVMAPQGSAVGAGAVALGNAVANDTVVDAILAGFAAAPQTPLAERLIAALDAGLAAGGELAPLRSAALRVAQPGVPFTPVDLRVDLSPTPIAELRRYWTMWAPMAAGYVERALSPDTAPSTDTIEGTRTDDLAGRKVLARS